MTTTWRTEALMQIIDVLWGELPADVVIELAETSPEIVEACRVIHDIVNHQGAFTPPEHHEGGLDLAGGGDLG